MNWYLIEGINPEPWAASEASIGRRNGKPFAHFHKPEQLRMYQESIQDEFLTQNPQAVKVAGEIEVVFYFWRHVATVEVPGAKSKSANYADATNLQKALEDALQGVLYDNDRDIVSVRSVIVEQTKETTPAILVAIGTDRDAEELAAIQHVRSLLTKPRPSRNSNIRNFDVGQVF